MDSCSPTRASSSSPTIACTGRHAPTPDPGGLPMHAIRKVLVAVKNPDSRRQPGIEKALRIARSLGASVELFHAISTPVLLDLQPLSGNSLADLRLEALALRTRRLEKWVTRAHRLGVPATALVEWDFPPHEAIVRRCIRARADLVI